MAASVSRSQVPATTCAQSRVSADAPAASSFPPSLPAPASRRIPSRNDTPSPWLLSTLRQWSKTSWSRAGSTSTHLPRNNANPALACMIVFHSARVSVSPSRDISTEKSIRLSSPRFAPPGCWPILTCTCGRAGWPRFHQSGRRTSSPLSSRAGASLRKRCASAGVQARGWKRRRLSSSSRARLLRSTARCTGASSPSSAA